MIEDVLAYFEESPVLDSVDANNSVRNLASILFEIEEITDIPVETCVSIVALINNMAVRNNSVARNHMMTYKLLDTRDGLVLHCLKCNSSTEACYELVAMPFESVIEQATFHDKLGPLFLLRHMHQTQSDPSLQILFASVIKHVCGTVADNRKLVARVMDDDDASTRLLGAMTGANVSEWLRILPSAGPVRTSSLELASNSALGLPGGLERSPMRGQPVGGGSTQRYAISPARNRPVSPSSSIGSANSGLDDEYMGVTDSIEDCEDFLEWYYSPQQDARRIAIESRIEKALAASDKSWRRLRERQAAGRSKAFRSRIDMARARETALMDGFNEEDKKVRARVERMGANHLRRTQQCIAERWARSVHV